MRRVRLVVLASALVHVLLLSGGAVLEPWRRTQLMLVPDADDAPWEIRLTLHDELPRQEMTVPVRSLPVEPILETAPIVASVPPQAVPSSGDSLSWNPHAPSAVSSESASGGTACALPPIAHTVRRVVYVLDRSGSMGLDQRHECVAQQVLAQLDTLPSHCEVRLLAYNRRPTWLGPDVWLSPREAAQVFRQTWSTLPCEGSSEHAMALRSALVVRPEAIVLLTDAADLTPSQVASVTVANANRTAISVVVLPDSDQRPNPTWSDLPRANRGVLVVLPSLVNLAVGAR